MDQDHELIELEQRGWAALAAGEGAAFYDEVCADEALMVFPGGMLLDRQGAVEGLRDAPGWASWEMADARVLPIGDGTTAAAVVYRATAQRSDEPPYRALMSSTYVRQGGSWRLALHQQSPL
jgi:hypothetical protein